MTLTQALITSRLLPSGLLRLLRKRRFSNRERVDCWERAATLLASGLSLEEVLQIQAETCRHGRDAVLADLFEELYRAQLNGRFLPAISPYVSSHEEILLGTLHKVRAERVFGSAARLAKIEEGLMASLRAELLPPAGLLLLCCAILWGAGQWFVPEFSRLTPLEHWSGISALFGQTAVFFADNALVLLLVMVIVLGLIRASMVLYTGAFRDLLDRVPPWSLYKFLQGISFLYTLLEFLCAGLDVNADLLEKMEKQSGPYLRSRIAAIRFHAARSRLGAAMLAAGHDFPTLALIPTFVALEGRKDWERTMLGFTETWIARSKERIREMTAALNLALFGLAFLIILGLTISLFELLDLQGASL